MRGQVKKTTWTLAALIAFSALLLGCSPTEEDATGAARLAINGSPGEWSGKLEQLMTQLQLRQEQRASVRKLALGLHDKMKPARKLRHEAMQEIARQVRKGRVDRSRIDSLLNRAEVRRETHRPLLIAALNELHRILDPPQRAALVDHLENQLAARRPPHLRTMKRLMKQLGLSDEQQERIKGYAKSLFREGRAKHIAELLELKDQLDDAATAFKSDSFDANRLPVFTRAHDHHRAWVQKLVRLTDLTLPILTAEQRSSLAALIETRALLHKSGWIH